MAKKTEVVKNTKTKKRTAITGEKPVVKTVQTKSAVTRKPAATAKSSSTSKPGKSASTKPLQDVSNFVVFGTVKYTDATPAAGLTVIAYDKDVSGADTLGQPAVTTLAGSFTIPYSEADFRKTKKEIGGADVIVCVYNDKQELLFTSKKQNNAPAKYELNITLLAEQFVVRGKVTDANQKPLANMFVRAYERDLRIPQFLGTDETKASGDYRIAYSPADFQLGDVPTRRAPWLIVEVRATSDGELLARQEVQKAARDQTVLFTLASVGAVSEWQRISETVAPLLKGQGGERVEMATRSSVGDKRADLAPYDITSADVGYIVMETGLDRAAVEAWAASSRMSRDAVSRLTDEYAAEQSLVGKHGWSFFFGLARQGLASDLDAALRASRQAWEKAWKAAQSAYRVPALNEKKVTLLMDALQLLQRLQKLDPQHGSNSDLVKVLAGLSQPLPKAVALDALEIFQEKGLDDIDAFLALEKNHPDAAAPIKTFVRGVRVHQLTSGHEGFSRLLNARMDGASDSIEPLAALPSTEWITMAAEASISPGLALQTQAQVEKQHPLTALQAKVSTGNFELPGVSSGEMAALIKEQPEFTESILKGTKRIKDTVDGEDTPAAHKVLRDMGRFMHTGISMELGLELIKGGISSPGLALRYGEDFVRTQLLETLPKEAAYEVAASMFEFVEPIIHGANGFLRDVAGDRAQPAWMYEEVPLALPGAVRENLPTLPGLFGDLDECICRPCESMLGQSAYLVDLLNLLGKPLRDLLKSKRSDIFTLPLSCENSDTKNTTQHIDIVLEILEKAGAPTASTNATKDEIQQLAYGNLASAIFPWDLPFDYGYAKSRAYMDKFGVTRTSLQLLRTGTTPEQLAAEGLGLTFAQTASPGAKSEWQLFTEQRAGAALWAVYGFNSSIGISLVDPASGEKLENMAIADVLTRVSVLIDRTGLELDELEQTFKTEFVSGYQGGLSFSNRDQCKTSEMRVPLDGEEGEVALLTGYLDRLHRFTRLRSKLPDWSITQLNKAIAVCGGMENGQITADVLIKLATLKRLHEDHGIPLEHLFDLPASTDRLRKTLGLTELQFSLLKTVTALHLTVHLFNWAALEEFCNAAKRIRESGLSVEQVAQALLTRGQLKSDALFGELPPMIKTDEQIEKLLTAVQQHLRSVVAVRPDLTLESQAIEALSEIFDAVTADKLVKTMRDAGATTPTAPNIAAPSAPVIAELVRKLSVSSNATHILGEWLPLLDANDATSILTVLTDTGTTTPATNNLSADARFKKLLNGIATRRRERELIAVIVEQCGLSEPEVIALLGSRLLLDPPAPGQFVQADKVFLHESFWADTPANQIPPAGPPSVAPADVPRLHVWMDRLYRLINLGTALKIDSELMRIADGVAVGDGTGLNWRDILAAVPATGSAWSNPNWQALLDMLWLQQPEQLSRPIFIELSGRLATLARNGAQAVTTDAVRPLATRLEISDAQTLAIAAQTTAVTTDNLRDPSKLRRAFELLLLARHLGANDTQIAQIANLTNNVQAATTAEMLLQARLGEQERKEVWKSINDKLRQQRRDALVAYLIHRDYRDEIRTANDLYERHLIDPQMEPCFETTRVLEAITATQLFAQRILFGLEKDIRASQELKDRWTWMRNYRVWEANRKVFLFPENWLFPELRDDKSSSFKQLESALGQGELNQDLANQSFGQFLDDVAQMGQVQVLGMYEDISRDSQGNVQSDKYRYPLRRTLYVIGRTLNSPYAYFWRNCVDFGSPFMEWSPWQRIELDIQGDHVLPFVLGGQLYIAWPLIRAIKIGSEGAAKDGWEVKLAWSRHDGKSWRKSSVSRDFWSGEAAAFTDERRGFAFRGETALDDSKATIFVYALTDEIGAVTEIGRPSVKEPTPSEWDLSNTYPGSSDNPDTAFHFLDTLIRNNHTALPEVTKKQLEIYATWRENIKDPIPVFQGVLLALMEQEIISNHRVILFSNPEEAAMRYQNAGLPNNDTRQVNQAYIDESTVHFLWAYWRDAQRILPQTPTSNYAGFNSFYEGLRQVSSRRTVICKAWIKLKAPDGTNPIAFIPLKGDENEGIYSCRIGSKTIPFNPGVPYPMDWKLGDQPEEYCTLSFSPKIKPASTTILEAPQGDIYKLRAILKGYEETQTVHFVIDGTMHDAIKIGFDLDALKTLKPVAKYLLSRDDMVTKLPPRTPQTPIYNPVGVSQPWMNGFREIAPMGDPEPVSPLYIDALNPAHRTNIFSPTKAGQFWAVGAATSKREEAYDVVEEIPSVWHFSESERGGYIDLGYRVGLADSGFRVYPEAYPEATLRRSDWSQSRTLPVARNQISDFGAKNLPIPANDSSTKWTDVVNGVYTFDARLPYACYNWEVFFHAPLLIADQLSKQHKFEDAEQWLRYVFDPTSTELGTNAKRFLKFRVFHELNLNQQVIDDLTALAQAAGGFATDADIAAVEKLINRWRDAPFRPFLIARRRHIAFLWRTLFAYLDNLIAWADSLYRRDTIESINEAAMLYVLAERILGRRPKLHKGSSNREALSYEAMAGKLDEFANYWIDVVTKNSNRPTHLVLKDKDGKKQPSPDGMLYFCMPFNDKILSYWNTVDARLSNIRNCRNIEGIQRTLPLMDAPIDPELLIRATAAGLNLGDVIAGLYAPPPHYRYSILSARAAELTNEAKALGAAMLSAIEKRDAEHLAQLRSSNEISLLKLVKDVRTLQISEAESNIEALRGSRRTIESRYRQYQRLLGVKDIKVPREKESVGELSMLGQVDLTSSRSNWGLIKEENEQYDGFKEASGWSTAAGIAKTASGVTHALGAIFAPNPATDGGYKAFSATAHGFSAVGDGFSIVSQGWKSYAEQQGMMAGHIRRRDEWAFQSNQTLKELQQIDKQILANQIRIDITGKELNNHIEQIEQAKAVDEVMRSKFSNEQLYEWMKTELSKLYFNAYRMALEMARKAERAAARELGVKPLTILGNAYWDSLRDGLLAGERLHQDLKRLEITYLDQNRREFELTKHISLRRLDPKALVNMRVTKIEGGKKHNKCEFEIPEWLFDLDTPGHYLRRIKSVSVSIPSVVGPYTSVNCKLTLLNSHVRHDRVATPATYRRTPTGDDRFTDYYGASEAIVTSTGNADSGLFETQLRDERFLPFEGSGVISEWRLELPAEFPQFDYSTISDVVLSIRYTARDGGDSLREAATDSIAALLVPPQTSNTAPLLFPVVLSCRSEFPTEWARADMTRPLAIPITRNLLPYWMDAARFGRRPNITKLKVLKVSVADLVDPPTAPAFITVWTPTNHVPGQWPTDALDADGVGTGNLGTVDKTAIFDRIVLLSIGL